VRRSPRSAWRGVLLAHGAASSARCDAQPVLAPLPCLQLLESQTSKAADLYVRRRGTCAALWQLQSATLILCDACINTSITSLVAVSAGKHGRGPRRYCEPVYWHGLTLVNHGTQAEVLRGVEARPALARGSSLAVGAPHGELHSYGCTPRVWQSHGCG